MCSPCFGNPRAESAQKVDRFGDFRFINTFDNAVDESLMGFALANKDVELIKPVRVIVRKDYRDLKGKVKVISGGGAGHEPAHHGYVGKGMLTAAVVGNVFAAPKPSNILYCIHELTRDTRDGVLLIVTNYTEDRLNFAVAMERARNEGIDVRMLVVGEDCSIPNLKTSEGRRGHAGIVLLHKMAGSMAEAGRSLAEIFRSCRSVTLTDMATISVCCKPPSIPATRQIKAYKNELELGLGIDGEVGVHMIPLGTVSEVVGTMLEHMLNPSSNTHLSLEPGCSIAVLINNLGGASKLEEYIFCLEVLKQFAELGYKVDRCYVGSYLTTFDAHGFSVTALKLGSRYMVKYLDAPTTAPAWHSATCPACVDCSDSLSDDKTCETEAARRPGGNIITTRGMTGESRDGMPCHQGICPHSDELEKMGLIGPSVSICGSQIMSSVVTLVCDTLIACEKQLNHLDADGGDADTGTTLKRGAIAVKTAAYDGALNFSKPYATLECISLLAEVHMEGIAGGLYAVFFTAAANHFQQMSTVPCDQSVDIHTWLGAMQSGIRALMLYGRAQQGDRSMVDALVPAAQALEDALKAPVVNDDVALQQAAQVAQEAAQATRDLKEARVGRASYAQHPLKSPDPGAHAVGIIMRAISEGVRAYYCGC